MHSLSDAQARLALHGCIVILFGMFAGIGFSYAAAVADTSSQLYGMWKFAHLEGITNGMMVLVVAGIWHKLEGQGFAVTLGRWTLLLGAYCNAIGPWLTALFVGHRVIQPETFIEHIIVFGFYVPGTIPLLSFLLFAFALATRKQ